MLRQVKLDYLCSRPSVDAWSTAEYSVNTSFLPRISSSNHSIALSHLPHCSVLMVFRSTTARHAFAVLDAFNLVCLSLEANII